MNLLKTTPYKHQEHVIELSKDAPYFGLFMEQGTGKTPVGIATFTHLFNTGKINGVLILAPNGVHDNWTRLEIPKHCGVDDIEVATWHGSDGIRKKKNFDWSVNKTPLDTLLVIAANIEAVRTESFMEAISPFLLQRQFLLIVDESTVVKNPKADQTKETFKIARCAKYTRILTGTPITQSPLDLWAQCRVLSPNALAYPSYTAFKHEFAIEQQMIFGQRRFMKVVGYKNQDKLAALIAPFTYRVLKKDCLDLPPKVYQTRFVEMTNEQKRIYRELTEQCLANLGKGSVVTVTTAITMLLRLHQITLGYVGDDEKNLRLIEHNRITALADMMEEADCKKAIIFCRFLEDVKQVFEASMNLGIPAVCYTGDENPKERAQAVDRFQNDPDVKWFIATSAASKGLTLTAAEQVIYYSQGYSMETRAQSEDRAHRLGQHKTVVYTDLCCRGTIEDKIVQALQAKKELANSVLDRAELAQLMMLEE